MKKLVLALFALAFSLLSFGQGVKKVYNEDIDPDVQISGAVAKAAAEGKYVVCQVGGNWCKWCLWFAAFVESDEEIKKLVDDNFEYIHVNYNPRAASAEKGDKTSLMLSRLGNPQRFGFPALVVLDGDGKVVHIQDSSFLEDGQGYDRKKVLKFFNNWTPGSVNPK